MSVSIKARVKSSAQKYRATLIGKTPIMFDRFVGMKAKNVPPSQRLYLHPDGSRQLTLPVANILSFFTATNTESATRMIYDPRTYKTVASAIFANVEIGPENMIFTRAGKPIVFEEFDQAGFDKSSRCYVDRRVARLAKGIPNDKIRPVLPLPWSLEFDLTLTPNDSITAQDLANILTEGGKMMGLGTFRKLFGKFEVASFLEVE